MTDPRIDELELDRLWEDLIAGRAPVAPYNLPFEVADEVRLFHSLTMTPPSDAARERIDRQVHAEIERREQEHAMNTTISLTVVQPAGFGGRRQAHRFPSEGWRPRALARGGTAMFGRLALVAVLLIAAMGIYELGWNRGRPSGGPNNIVVAPTTTNGCGTAAATPIASPIAVATPGEAGTVNVEMATHTAAKPVDVSLVWTTDSPPIAGSQVIGYVTLSPQCQLWVTDIRKNQFLVFDLNGTLIDKWGTKGSGDGQINLGGNFYYAGIAFAPDGGFYICDTGNKRIDQFDANRQFVRSWTIDMAGETGATPYWIGAGPDGTVYAVTDGPENVIRAFTENGQFIRGFGTILTLPGGTLDSPGPLAIDSEGDVWMLVPSTAQLARFAPTGEPLSMIDISSVVQPFIFGFAIDAAGRFYVQDAGNSRIAVLNSDGTLHFGFSSDVPDSPQPMDPFSIAVDDNGGVYVLSSTHARIQKFQIHE